MTPNLPIDTQRQALRFLAGGPHRMDAIDSDEALAAFMVFDMLRKAGLAACIRGNGRGRGPEYRLTIEGVDRLVEMEDLARREGKG